MFRRNPRLNDRLTFRVILIFLMVAIISVMTILMVVTLENTNLFFDQLDDDLNRIVKLQALVEDMDEVTSAVSNYSVSGDETYLLTFNEGLRRLEPVLSNERKISDGKERYYLYHDLENMFLSYTEESEALIQAFEASEEQVYINAQINELRKNNGFVKGQLSRIISYELIVIEESSGDIEENVNQREEMLYVIIFIVIVITLFISSMVANLLARPIHQLSIALNLIGKGEYNIAPLEENGVGELNSIIKEFNKMKIRLNERLDLLQENTNIKEQLKNSEIDLLEKENHLKQSKLDFLQSQINPHFLYNTLNSIQTLADIEEAPQTELMLEHLSSLMRYNVKKVNTVVMLEDEINVIESYVYIQLIRFGNRIKYQADCDDEALRVQIPSMILQPLVENAMIHGLEPMMENGTLTISAQVIDEHVKLVVKDNGDGMPKEILERLLAYGEGSDEETEVLMKNAKSIGVANVIRRCKLFYGTNVVTIYSEKGKGTEFVFMLPID